ncbi:glycosyl hydrolase family 61-domain-containing protein [Podospora didyma]|uniref:lytic cellulose monooxygenase (C4-dehydrogenating) n=1 Tax=Podospora didyma TaxID=330526 RepID=A0AAE0JYV5_9PEZI|nr:glycosyl hydrolase family 61-domain-containing protein [Podospora didyma]
MPVVVRDGPNASVAIPELLFALHEGQCNAPGLSASLYSSAYGHSSYTTLWLAGRGVKTYTTSPFSQRQQGFEDGEWAVTILIRNLGRAKFILPKSLPAGLYLVRQEIIALHQADYLSNDPANPRGAEFYVTCVQFNITGSGTKMLD